MYGSPLSCLLKESSTVLLVFGYIPSAADLKDGPKVSGRIAGMKKLMTQIIRFAVVGVVAFLIDFVLLVFLTEVIRIDYIISATISFIVSVVFNYIASMRFVFEHREELDRKQEFVTFIVLSVIGLLINDALMWLGVTAISIDYRAIKIIATGVVMVFNFVTRKIFLDAGNA